MAIGVSHMNFEPPDGEWDERDSAWQALLGYLSRTMEQAPKKPVSLDPDAWSTILAQWSPFIGETIEYNEHEREKYRKQWDMARGSLWCCRRVVERPELRYNELDRSMMALFGTQSLPDYILRHETWAWNLLHHLSGTLPGSHRRRIPIALSREDGVTGQLIGEIHWLDLEAFERGTGELLQHPIDALRTYIYSDFEDSMRDAWKTAKELAKREADVSFRDGRWRLLAPDDRPTLEVRGRSAGAAAAWGWYFALLNKFPDDEIVILGQLDQGAIRGVTGIEAKVKAIVAYAKKNGRFDTIVVANGNKEEAEKALLKALQQFDMGADSLCVKSLDD